jgi:hypothetical protein
MYIFIQVRYIYGIWDSIGSIGSERCTKGVEVAYGPKGGMPLGALREERSGNDRPPRTGSRSAIGRDLELKGARTETVVLASTAAALLIFGIPLLLFQKTLDENMAFGIPAGGFFMIIFHIFMFVFALAIGLIFWGR